MKSIWLHLEKRDDLIVFCNGWGMDERPFQSLTSARYDVLMFCDYRQLGSVAEIRTLMKGYAEVFLVTWSMGVWVGQRLFAANREWFKATLAINGTLCPIHDDLGIPEGIVTGTIQAFTPESRHKLYRRMCRDSRSWSNFQAQLPDRTPASQKEELEMLLGMCDCQRAHESIYSHIIISDQDLIMPTANQLRFWGTEKSRLIQGYHFPFYLWPSWDALLGEALLTVAADTSRSSYNE